MTGRGGVYLDASVLVAFWFSADSFNARASAVMRDAAAGLVLSDCAGTEFAAVVARDVRTGVFTPDQARATFGDFDEWSAQSTRRVEVTTRDLAAAERFIRRLDLNLRTLDAVHVAIAARIGADLATFDVAMAASARTLGCSIFPT